jgi:tripartite motif-containing protein 71
LLPRDLLNYIIDYAQDLSILGLHFVVYALRVCVVSDFQFVSEPRHPQPSVEWLVGGMAIDATTEQIFASDLCAHCVHVFKPNGDFVRSWGGYGTGEGQFNTPGGLAIVNNEVFVADSNNNRIQVFSTVDAKFIRQWGVFGTDDGGLCQVKQVVPVSTDGPVYVVDTHKMQKFDRQGNFICKWPKRRLTRTDDISVAVGADETVFVADSRYHDIEVFSPTGRWIRQWNIAGMRSPKNRFNRCRIVIVLDLLFVSDFFNQCIHVYRQDGQLIHKWNLRTQHFAVFGRQPKSTRLCIVDASLVSE